MEPNPDARQTLQHLLQLSFLVLSKRLEAPHHGITCSDRKGKVIFLSWEPHSELREESVYGLPIFLGAPCAAYKLLHESRL